MIDIGSSRRPGYTIVLTQIIWPFLPILKDYFNYFSIFQFFSIFYCFFQYLLLYGIGFEVASSFSRDIQ